MWWASLIGAAIAGPAPYAGVEWRPLSRGDLTWVTEGQTTGLTVGGTDGFARPNPMAYGGLWLTDHLAGQVSLGVARLTTTTWVDEIYTQRHWGVVRPAADLKFAFLERTDRRPVPWLIGGVHVDVPSSRDVSNGYTAEEQEAADTAAAIERARLGAWGGRFGGGATLSIVPGFSLGAQYTLQLQRSLFRGDDPTAISSWVSGEAALLFQLDWGVSSDE